MKENTYYTTGEFAKKAKVSLRTIRYYDKQGILKPTYTNEVGYRFYTDSDFAVLQKILTLKYLGFSLEEIMDLTMNDDDRNYVKKSLQLQLNLVREKIEHLTVVEQSLYETSNILEEKNEVDWERIIHLIQLMNMEKSIVEQYRNAKNINIRIELHKRYSVNKTSWFSFLFSNFGLKSHQKVLELGCGNGELWKVNQKDIPSELDIYLTDQSEGMIIDAKAKLGDKFTYGVFDCHNIPYENQSFDLVIGNHLLFYLKDMNQALSEIKRVLKVGGEFYCSTYGINHMKEISALVSEFDPRIKLSEVNLYEIFGLHNGYAKLSCYFKKVDLIKHEDCLVVDDAQLLMDYILSCHGNQKEYIMNRYEEFRKFIENKIQKTGRLYITKDAGVFRCKNCALH